MWDLTVFGTENMKILAEMLNESIGHNPEHERYPEEIKIARFAALELQKYCEDLDAALKRFNDAHFKEVQARRRD